MNTRPVSAGLPNKQPVAVVWQNLTASAVLTKLASDPAGLSAAEAALRLTAYGLNQLHEGKRISRWRILIGQFNSLLIWILLAASLISAGLGEMLDAIAIVAIVVLNAIIGYYQEYSAEQSIRALKSLVAPQAKVRRAGQVIAIPAAQIVIGDILALEAGDLIAADARLLETAGLSCSEAALTGESESVAKQSAALSAADIPLGDRSNMVFMGASVAAGTGLAVVVNTAMNTELGCIASLIKTAQTNQDTPLQRKLDDLGRILVWVAMLIVGLLFGLGLWRGTPVPELIMTAISLAVAAVPEGLPAVVTVALSVGVMRMARRGALLRKLAAVETLGSTSVICTDKTGTLTLGQMTVRRLYIAGLDYSVTGEGYGPQGAVLLDGKPLRVEDSLDLQTLSNILLGCNNAHLLQEPGGWRTLGDPTEGALLVVAGKAGGDRVRIELTLPKQTEIPFDSDRKRSSVIRRRPDGGLLAFCNGAPGAVLERCSHIYTSSGVRLLTAADSADILNQTGLMANQALRVLASAYRELADLSTLNLTVASVEQQMVFVGLAGMYDPPRPEVSAAVRKCQRAGIRVVMITGDHPRTALAIAREIGIAADRDVAMSGVELDKISDCELARRVTEIAVFARVSAAHKLRIVRAWQANDAVVAMAGDGVNDAPAIKGADIGVTMGKTGTEVTKQAADMIITDDNFATIVAAVEQGRGIYTNIQKTLQYLLAGGSGELLLMTVCVVAGLPAPLLPIHLLWINLVTDGLPALCLATEPLDADVMNTGPRRRTARMTNPGFFKLMLLTGLLTSGVVFGVYCYVLQTESLAVARSYAFSCLVFSELLRSFGARSDSKPVWRISLFSNINLLLVVGLTISLQFFSQHNAGMELFLKTTEISWRGGLALLAVAAIPLCVLEVVKRLRHRPTSPKIRPVAEPAAGFGWLWQLVCLAVNKFWQINAMQTAGAFAYYALFSILPLILLGVTCASIFIDRAQAATALIDYIKSYTPIGSDLQTEIFNTVNAVVKARGQATVAAMLMLVWSAMQFFTTLISATHQAWNDIDAKWWQLPLESLIFLGIMLGLLGMGVSLPLLVDMLADWLFADTQIKAWLDPGLGELISTLLVFFSLSLFYRLAPARPIRFGQVWGGALCATLLLQLAGLLFIGYLKQFGDLNPVYGAFSAIMAVLLWLYLSGCIFIFGACICAAPTLRQASASP